MVTLLNPARLSAARMASNSVGGSTTSTVHITVSRRLLPRRKNRFPSSGNPASAKARVTACVSAVSTAIRYRIDAGSLVARAQSLFSVGRSLSTDGAAVKLAQTLLSCLRRHLLALAARDDVGVRSEVCIRVPEPRADYFTANTRSEEHTSELQSPCNLVCRLLLEKKKKKKYTYV